jgi:hypothetical protein
MQAQRGAVIFHYTVDLNLTAKELKARFVQKESQRDADIEDLVFMSKSEYVKHLETCGRDVTRVLVGVV